MGGKSKGPMQKAKHFASVPCVLLSALLALSLGGCTRRPTTLPPAMAVEAPVASPSQAPRDTLLVAFVPSDSLNPCRVSTQINRTLLPLLYDSLMALDPGFHPENRLARSVEQNGTACTVRLRAGAVFWDGTPVTAADVAASFAECRARDSAGRYGHVASCEVVSGDTVRFTLSRPDAYVQNLLTFPVFREGTADAPIPLGSGRYRPDASDAPTRLLYHDRYPGEAPRIRAVELRPVENSQELGYLLLSGQLDVALLNPDVSPMETAGSFPVQTNDLVYLGFNSAQKPADQPSFRRAVDLLLDRYALVREGYAGRAQPASLPVNPAFLPAVPGEPDPELAARLLDEAGLDVLDEEGFRTLGGRELEIQLAFNVESPAKRELAAEIRDRLEEAHLRVALNEYSYEKYLEQVSGGGYTIYLGETRLPEDMSLGALLSPSGALHHALGDTQELYESYLSAREDEARYQSFLSDFRQQEPFVPLLFDQEVVAHTRNFYSAVVATSLDLFYNIHKW